MSEPKPQDADDALAILALLAQTGAVRGPRPTPLELLKLARGTLSVGRHIEVESHIAHDPRVFDAFVSGNKTIVYDKTLTRRAAPRWRRSLAALAACVVAVIGILLAMNVPKQDTSRRAHETQSRAEPTRALDWRRRAFRYGYENSAAHARTLDPSADSFSGACTAEGCGNEIEALTDFGAAFARFDFACRRHMHSGDSRVATSDEIRRLQRLRADVRDDHWLRQLDDLLVALVRPAPEACAHIERIRRLIGMPR